MTCCKCRNDCQFEEYGQWRDWQSWDMDYDEIETCPVHGSGANSVRTESEQSRTDVSEQ